MPFIDPLDPFMGNNTDEAVRQGSHCIVALRHDVPTIIAKIAGILKGKDLPPTVVRDPVAACHARTVGADARRARGRRICAPQGSGNTGRGL